MTDAREQLTQELAGLRAQRDTARTLLRELDGQVRRHEQALRVLTSDPPRRKPADSTNTRTAAGTAARLRVLRELVESGPILIRDLKPRIKEYSGQTVQGSLTHMRRAGLVQWRDDEDYATLDGHRWAITEAGLAMLADADEQPAAHD